MSQTTMILVSKTHIQTVKRLYKIIFQLHKSLPPELKAVGDGYVRNEFKLHKNAAPEHVKTFMTEWSVSKPIKALRALVREEQKLNCFFYILELRQTSYEAT